MYSSRFAMFGVPTLLQYLQQPLAALQRLLRRRPRACRNATWGIDDGVEADDAGNDDMLEKRQNKTLQPAVEATGDACAAA